MDTVQEGIFLNLVHYAASARIHGSRIKSGMTKIKYDNSPSFDETNPG
jgi:hypothetical protein